MWSENLLIGGSIFIGLALGVALVVHCVRRKPTSLYLGVAAASGLVGAVLGTLLTCCVFAALDQSGDPSAITAVLCIGIFVGIPLGGGIGGWTGAVILNVVLARRRSR